MRQLIVALLLFSANTILVNANVHRKCCKSGQYLVEIDSKLKCQKLKSASLQDNFENDDFISGNATGNCVEISGKTLSTFRVEDAGKVEKLQDLGNKFFPKCCPLDYRYNTTTHGCEKKMGNVLPFLKMDSFVRVGLPECEIISDKIYGINDVRMIGKDLMLIKENKWLEEKYCVDATLDGKLVVRNCENDIQICSEIMCIHKCCPDGQSFINGSICRDTFNHGVDLTFTKAILSPHDPFVLIYGFKPRIHKLSLALYEYHVDRFGVFSAYMNKTGKYDHYEVSNRSYCIEHALREKNEKILLNQYLMFASSQPPPIAMKFVVTRWIKVVSCFFLILTILVYLFLPKMRNLFGKILLNYCLSTLIFFGSLAISQFYSNDFNDGMCKGIGFLAVLSSIWSFTWLHIMCIDIWFSFGTPRTLSGPLQKKEWKRLLLYSLYGWGFPIIWVAMIAVFSVTHFMPEAMHPIIGKQKCYLENSDGRPGNYSYLIYVTLPLLIQQIVNTVLFVKTILYCLRIKAEIERMNDCEKRTALYASKERLGLIMKLAVIMGVLFIFETVSSIYNFQGNTFTTYVEVVWDSINCLQGLYIFIIFICKKKVYNSICDKIPSMKSRKISVSSTYTTQVSMNAINGSKNK